MDSGDGREEEEEDDAEAYNIRDYLAVQNDVAQADYELGILTLPGGGSANCVAIAEVGERILVAVPFSVWSRHRKRRKLDPDALSRVQSVEVAAARTADRTQQDSSSVIKVWMGLLAASREADFSPAESDIPDYPFVTTEGIENVLPLGEALSAVAQDHFTFLSAAESAAPAVAPEPVVGPTVKPPAGTLSRADERTEQRFQKIEGALAGITDLLTEMRGAQGGQTSVALVPPAQPAVEGTGLPDRYPGLDPGVVQQAIQAGIGADVLAEMSALAADPAKDTVTAVPETLAKRAQLAVAPKVPVQGPPGLAEGSGVAGPRATPLETCVQQLATIMQQMHEDKAQRRTDPRDLDALLDRAGEPYSPTQN